MKKRICALFMGLVMLALLIIGALPSMAADGDITLRIHYHRQDGNYEGWNLWLWEGTSVPSTEFKPPYQFEKVGDKVVVEVKVNPGTMKVGFIVRRSTETKPWAEKDIKDDQFIDIAGVMSGTLNVYIESGVAGYKIEEDGPVIRKLVIVQAQYKEKNSDGNPQVMVQMSNKITDCELTNETFTVFNRNETATIIATKEVNTVCYLTLSEPLDPLSGYLVKFKDEQKSITMPDKSSTKEFEDQFTYTGNDLGFIYTAEKTSMRVWIPLAEEVAVKLYRNGDPAKDPNPFSVVKMTKDVNGTWVCELPGDMQKTYYTFEATYADRAVETCDPYAKSTGVNGERAMIFDLDTTDPEGWENDRNPNAGIKMTDMIIGEVSIRDIAADASSGIKNKGTFLGLTEKGTKNSKGLPTGLDYLAGMGFTHIHFLPFYDFGSLDETLPADERGYNWGYDPVTPNVPDGTFSTDPTDGTVRVKELKQMVQALHESGLSVVMDVVYNHVYDAGKFSFNQLVPGYYVRPGSNGSGCGNDVASEKSMVKKFIVDSVNYWADEYHIDGFRFDLMGLLDTETMNEIVRTVREKHPDVIFYGEGWQMPTKLTKTGYTLANQSNASAISEIAMFNDGFRNTVKGNSYGGVAAGWISGGNVSTADLNNCFMGRSNWCKSPSQSVNYISSHDNNTLFDHITMVASNASLEERIAMNKLGAAFNLTASGIPFFQIGEEMLRSKADNSGFIEDSYNAPDSVNSLKWDDLIDERYMNVSNYYKGLIAFRKAHPALRLSTAAEVDAAVKPMTGLPNGVVAYNISGGQDGESADAIFCAFNGSKNAVTVTLPEGEWDVFVDDQTAGITKLRTVSGSVELPACSAVVLAQGIESIITPPLNLGLILVLSSAVLVTVAVCAALLLKKKR